MYSSEKLAVRNFGVRGHFFFFFKINLFLKVLLFEENAKYSFIIQILTLKIKCLDSVCFPQQMVEVSDAFLFPFSFMGLAKYYLPEYNWFFTSWEKAVVYHRKEDLSKCGQLRQM